MSEMMTVLTAGVSMGSVMNNGMSLGERLAYGLRMTAVGMLTIFAVLGVIYLVMLIFGLVFGRAGKKKPEPQPQVEAPVEEGLDPALVAVLTAAVAAVLAEEARASGTEAPAFRVVSFRRTARGWNEKL